MADFVIGECICRSGSVVARFGFSATGKPKASMICYVCNRQLCVIGRTNENLLEIWKGAFDNGNA